MRTITESELLGVWERGWSQPPAVRALTLLAAARPDLSPQERGRLSVGDRDAQLLALRERLFGPAITGCANCPDCRELTEFTVQTSDLLAVGNGREGRSSPGTLTVREGGYEVLVRLPNGDDLVAGAAADGVESLRRDLLDRCVVKAVDLVREGGPPVATAALPDEILDAVSRRMAEADPLADIRLALSCPSCTSRWGLALDVADYLWSEVDSWARRLLLDVHALALAYGWDEPTVLALTPWRRECYLGMVRG
jgi:hypothetical protein